MSDRWILTKNTAFCIISSNLRGLRQPPAHVKTPKMSSTNSDFPDLQLILLNSLFNWRGKSIEIFCHKVSWVKIFLDFSKTFSIIWLMSQLSLRYTCRIGNADTCKAESTIIDEHSRRRSVIARRRGLEIDFGKVPQWSRRILILNNADNTWRMWRRSARITSMFFLLFFLSLQWWRSQSKKIQSENLI